jgi:hypothetical protein
MDGLPIWKRRTPALQEQAPASPEEPTNGWGRKKSCCAGGRCACAKARRHRSFSDPIRARDFGTRVSTIKMRVRQIMSKFGVANHTQAAMMATMRGNIALSRLEPAMP